MASSRSLVLIDEVRVLASERCSSRSVVGKRDKSTRRCGTISRHCRVLGPTKGALIADPVSDCSLINVASLSCYLRLTSTTWLRRSAPNLGWSSQYRPFVTVTEAWLTRVACISKPRFVCMQYVIDGLTHHTRLARVPSRWDSTQRLSTRLSTDRARGSITVSVSANPRTTRLMHVPGLKLAMLASLPESVLAKASEVSTKLTELETEGSLWHDPYQSSAANARDRPSIDRGLRNGFSTKDRSRCKSAHVERAHVLGSWPARRSCGYRQYDRRDVAGETPRIARRHHVPSSSDVRNSSLCGRMSGRRWSLS